LAEVCGIVSDAGINIIAACAYAVDNKGFILFVSEDNKRAQRFLKDNKFNVREEEVICLTIDNKPGALKAVTKNIARAGIDLTLLYGSVNKKSKTSEIILVSEDNKAAMMVIKLMGTR
jgi:hypothetical protein